MRCRIAIANGAIRAAGDDDAWHVEAHVTRNRSRYTLELILRGPDEQMARRTLTSASCAALAETTAVMVSLALEAAKRAPVNPPAICICKYAYLHS